MADDRTNRRELKIYSIEVTDQEGESTIHYPEQNQVTIYCCKGKIQLNMDCAEYNGLQWSIQAIAQANGCRLINLGPQDIGLRLGQNDETGHIFRVDTLRHIDYGFGVIINDDHSFTFYRKKKARSLEVDFYLPEIELRPDEPLEGTITLHNTGDNPRVRFHISVNITGLERGLKPYVLESTSPQLNYTRELPVKLSLFHPSDQALQAGYYPIEIKVTSGEYQGQVAADYQEFFVPSIYDVGVSFDNPAPCGEQQSGEDRDCVDC